MIFLKGLLFVWLVWGASMLIMNTKDFSILAASKLRGTGTWRSVLQFPLLLLMCVMLIIIYPPITIKKYVMNLHNLYSKKNEKL